MNTRNGLNHFTHSLAFILMWYFASSLNADTLQFEPDKPVYDLSNGAIYCIDAGQTIHPELLLNIPESTGCSTLRPSGYIDSDIWIINTIQSGSDFTGSLKRIIQLQSPLLDFIDLSVWQNDLPVVSYETGDMRPYANRPFPGDSFRFPLDLEPNTTVTLIWKIRSTSTIDLPMTLNDPKYLAQHDTQKHLVDGFFYGVLAILAVYNAIFFIIFRKSIYLYYVGFVVSYSLMQLSFDGLAGRFFWPDHPWLTNEGVPFFVTIAVMTAILFGQRFLDTANFAPRMHKILTALILIDLIPMILLIPGIYLFPVKLTVILAILTPLALIAATFAIYRHHQRTARLYLVAWSLFFFGSITMALYKLGVIPPSWWVLHSQQFGVIFKILVLSYALGDQLQSLLYVDQLTGTWNRHYTDNVFDIAKKYSKKSGHPFAVLSMDIDDFKTINDTLTHRAGDKVLQQLAKRVKTHLRTSDTVMRLGQDEFLIILERIRNTDNLTIIAEQILEQIRKPFTISGQLIHITASMGIAIYQQDGDDHDTLIKNCDSALHKAKDLGKNRFHYYNPTLDNNAMQRLRLHNDLFSALENNQLFLVYQPKVDSATGVLKSFEALLRWQHPEQGLVSPDVFIAIAEQNDLILRLTRWVLDESCRQIKVWQEQGLYDISVAVNITAKDLKDDHFLPDILTTLEAYNLPPGVVELELTERILIEDSENGLQRIAALHDAGISVALDDFGTGYSSFSYLQTTQISTLKIDKSFVDRLEPDGRTYQIVASMIGLGHNLGMKIVAEGVENAEQLALLKSLECDLIQGYHIDKPLSVEAITQKYLQT